MIRKALTAIAALTFLAPLSAQAKTKLNYGTELELEVFNDDQSFVTFTPYVEREFPSGIYTGVELYNVHGDDDNESEFDLYLGYRGEAGLLSYDIYYYRYYLNQTGYDSDDLTAEVSDPLFGQLVGTTSLTSDLSGGWSGEQEVAYALPAGLELSAIYGVGELADDDDWEIGIAKSLNETTEVGFSFNNSETREEFLSFTLAFDASIDGIFGR
jgi:hypothetical protein